jgi:glycosyltransferase involved in cell wall biosynthesis
MKKKLLFIPADNISLKISRSYYLAKGLGDHFDVYFVTWYDPQDNNWSGKASRFAAVSAFYKSLFRSFRVRYSAEDNFYTVQCPVFLVAFVHKLIGYVTARKVSRVLNGAVLKYLVGKLRPDVVFFADGFFVFPHVQTAARTYADIQDDYDEERKEVLAFEKNYIARDYAQTVSNYTITPAAVKRLQDWYESKFNFLPNGADFDTIRGVTEAQIGQIRQSLGLAGHYVLSYIGSYAKFDEAFVIRLAQKLAVEMPEVKLVLVGKLPEVKLPNVVNIGPLPPERAAQFFRLSDAGIILNDTSQSKFLNNSLPLKIIQYAAARKPVLTFPLSWVGENDFSNVKVIEGDDLDRWVAAIRDVQRFRWTERMEEVWSAYDWKEITRKLAEEIQSQSSPAGVPVEA